MDEFRWFLSLLQPFINVIDVINETCVAFDVFWMTLSDVSFVLFSKNLLVVRTERLQMFIQKKKKQG